MPTLQSGFMTSSSLGTAGDYQLVIPSLLGGFVHRARHNDEPGQPWTAPVCFGSGATTTPSFFESKQLEDDGEVETYMELIARTGDRLVYYCRENEELLRWFGPFPVREGVCGNAAVRQTRSGDFDLVTPLAAGGLAHLHRNNADPEKPWTTVAEFAGLEGLADGVALVESTFGGGNLEIVVSLVSASGNRLAHYWWNPDDAESGWIGPEFIYPDRIKPAPGASPAMIQNGLGTPGNFELVVALEGGGYAHLTRRNDQQGLPWLEPVFFGEGQAGSVSLVQAASGAIEMAAQVGNEVHIYTLGETGWNGPVVLPPTDALADGPTQGQWNVPFSSSVVGIHGAVLHTGNVLFVSYKSDPHSHGGEHSHPELGVATEGDSAVVDPVTGSSVKPVLERNPFCAGHAPMPDGRILIAGGGSGGSVDSYHTFTPRGDGGEWTYMGLMTKPRWYPTVTPMSDGKMFVISGTTQDGPENGTNLNATYEIFDPATNQHSDAMPATFLNESTPFALYPFCHHLPSGRMFVHAGHTSRLLDPGTGQVDPVAAPCVRETARTYRIQGAGVLLPLMPDSDPPYRARVMVIGGGSTPIDRNTPATETCELLDLGADPLAWQPAASMEFGRVMCDAVLLPDGKVLVTGGSAAGLADEGVNPVLPAELYDPATDTWTRMASTRVPRLYHSLALLLPDGRVMTSGQDEVFNPEPYKYPELRLEVFSPPYLFRGPRPRITSAPDRCAAGAQFTVESPDAASIASACMMRPSAVTHSCNMSQRLVGLRILDRGTGNLRLEAPPASAAPPGYYMLFLLNGDGVPSVAAWLQLTPTPSPGI